MNSHNAMQYSLIKVNRVSNPLFYLFLVDDDTMELFSDNDYR